MDFLIEHNKHNEITWCKLQAKIFFYQKVVQQFVFIYTYFTFLLTVSYIMNKLALLLLTALISFNVHSKEKFCSYVDFFHPSTNSNPYIYISKVNSDKQILIQALSNKSFEIRDGGNCSTGYAHVTYYADASHWCMVDIKDGPSMWHPTATASCFGFTFRGLISEGKHSYTFHIVL